MATEDCPICLNSMAESDLTYALLCPTNCGYNFCLKCVEHLVASSQCDYELASDGNRHVKVQLQCPQCRGDLSNTIRDTLLLRKAVVASEYMELPDSELNATQLQIKHEFTQRYAKDVEHAEARLRKFRRDNGQEHTNETIKLNGSQEEKAFTDETLFGGLSYAMSEAEQSYVTELMTSGVPDKLAQAAQILHGIMELSMKGITPSMKKTASANVDRRAELRKMELLDQFRKRHPLPARMPKFSNLTVFSTTKPMLTFTDDEWDGSIADAYSRVHGPSRKTTPALERILDLADSEFCSEPKQRVKIRSVKGQAGRVGLQKGDVVTHVNGEQWEGTADELSEAIARMHEEDSYQTFPIVVNAEPAVAEVLKLRGQECQLAIEEDSTL